MATEADVPEPVSLMERGVNRCLNPGELNLPSEAVDYLVKEVASNVAVEIVHSSFEDNAGVTAGESFFESPSVPKVPDEETSTKQETCQADKISYQAEKTMLDKKQIKEEESFKAAEEIRTKEEEVMNEINTRAKEDERSREISHATRISSGVEKIEQQFLKIGEEETSKEDILFDQVEANKQDIIEENQTNDLQKDEGEGRKSNKDADVKSSNQAAILEASTGHDEEPLDLNPDLTVHSLDTGVETSTQASLKNEAEDNGGHAETVTFEENNGEKISRVGGEHEDSCPSFLDGEKNPDEAKPIEKIESEEEDTRYNSIGEASSILATSPEIQSNTGKSFANMEDGKDKLDSPSATLATDRSCVQGARLEVGEKLEDTSNIESTENQEEVDKAEISKVVSETLSEYVVKPQESTNEALETKPEAESSGGEKVKGETTAEGKLENLFVKHEDGETNKDEGVTTSEASARGNIDKSRDTVVEDEDNIRDAVITPEYNQDGLGNEKNLPPTKLNEKTEIEEVEVQNKICSELDTTHSLVAEKKLRQDSDFEPQNQVHETNGTSKCEEKHNENDTQACESTEKTILEYTLAKEAVTTEPSSETSDTEIEKSEKVQELDTDEESEIKDAKTSIKEDAPNKEETSETQNHKSEITGDNTAKCHTEESTSEKFSSTDFLYETIEQNFQAASLYEAATASKDDEEEHNEKTRSTINEEITGTNKVTEENIGDNVTNLSSEVINRETVEGYQQTAKEADISEGEDTKEQSIEGNNIACISLEAVEESPVKNFQNDENNTESFSNREILVESETAETIDSITNEGKQSDEILNSTIQCSLVQEQEFLQSENISEGSSVEETNVDKSSIKNDEDKENQTGLPLAEIGECNKEILKGDEDLEQIMQKNESKENIEYPLIISAETDTGTSSQLEQKTLEVRVESPQDNKMEAEKEKEENIINGSIINSLPQESIAQDTVNFQNDDSCTDKSSAGILEESTTTGTCESFSNETNQNAESPIETIPTSLANAISSSECFRAKDDTAIENWEESSDKKDKEETSVDNDNIRNETVKLKNLPPRELNEKIKIAEFETPEKNVSGLNVTHSVERELVVVIDFEPQDQVHEANRVGIDEVKNDETEFHACQSTENTDLELPSARGAENKEASLFTSETEIEKLEKIDKLEPKEKVESKGAKMSICEDIENKEEACEKEIHKLATSDDIEKYHTEEVSNTASLHETDEQKFQAATTLEGEENSKKTVSIINEEIMGVGDVADEDIKENFRQLSLEVFNKDTTESYQQTEKETDVTKGANTEEQVMEQNNVACNSQKSDKEAVENSQSYEKKSDKPNSGEIFEEYETPETVDGIASEAKQIDESPNSAPQCSQVKEHENSQNEYLKIYDGSSAEEIDMDGSSIKKEEDNEKYTGLAEVGEHSEELLKGEDVEEKLKDEQDENIEQPLNVISEETKAGASSQTDDNTVEETVESRLNNERDGGTEKEDIVNESNIKCLLLESVAKNYAKNFENDENSAEKSKTEILEESEAVETGENITHEANRNYENPIATVSTSLAKEVESLKCEDKSIPEEASPEEKREEGSPIKIDDSITMLEENSKEINKEPSETAYQLVHEMNQNEESPNSSLKASVVRKDAKQILQKEETRENTEQPHKTIEETVERPQDNEKGAETTKEEDIINENNNRSLSFESLAHDPVKNFENDGGSAEKSNIEIPEQSEAANTIEDITHETNQNDSPSQTPPAPLAEDLESLQCEDRDIPAEASPEEKKEEPSSIKISIDNDRITLEEANKDSNQETSKTVDYSAHEMMNQCDESLNSSIQASAVREQETPQGTELDASSEVVSNPKEETGENSQDKVKETEMPEEEDDSKEHTIDECNIKSPFKESVEERTNKNRQNDEDNVEMSNREIFEESATGETGESIVLETNQNYESPSATIPTAPVKEEETLQGKGKNVNLAETLSNEKEDDDGSPIKAGEVNDSNAELAEAIKNREKEISHGEDIIEPKMQNEPEEFLESSPDVITEESKAAMSKEKADDISIPEEVGPFQNSEETVEKETEEASKESVEGTNKNFQNDKDNAEISKEEIFEESATGETNESIALEKNQNYEGLNAIIPTAPVKEEESLQGKGKNVNLEDNDSNAELAEAIKNKEKEISLGKEIIEPKLQNEPKEFLESSQDVLTEESRTGMLNEEADDISIPEEVRPFQNSEETLEKETKEASKESVEEGTNKNLQNDEDNTAMSNKEIFEESATSETGESTAVETNQNNESPSATIFTSSVKEEESLQGKGKNVNLAEASLEEKKEDDGSPIKATEVNNSNVELEVAIKDSEKEVSHGEEIVEPKLQNEAEESLELSRDVITKETKEGMLNEKPDDNSIPEEVGAFKYSEETVEKEKGEASKESVEGTKKNLQIDEENAEISNKEIFEQSAAGKTGESIALETNQNYESPNATMPTAPLKEEENLQRKFKNGNLAEALSEEKKEDDESPIKASEVNDSNPELGEAIKKGEKEISHGEEIIELKLQNEQEEFLESSRGILNEKADDIGIPEDNGALQNTEETKEKETEGNEDTDGSKVNSVSASEDVKLAIKICDANLSVDDVVKENSVTSEMELERIKAHGLDSVENLGKYTSENTEEEMKKDIIEVHRDKTVGLNEDIEKHITIAEYTTTDISPQPAGKETDLSYKGEEEKPQAEIEGKESEFTEEIDARGYELAKEVETSQDKQGSDLDLYPAKASEEQMLPKGVGQEDRRQLESSGTDTQEEGVTVERKGTMVDRVDMNASQDDVSNFVENRDHEIPTKAGEAEDNIKHEIQDKALIERNDDQNEMIVSETFLGKIPDENLKERSELPSNNTELMNSKESKPIDDNSVKDPTASENIEIEWISQVTEPAHDEDKISTAEEISELGIVDAGKVNRDEEAGSFQSKDLHQDLELHDKQIISTTEEAENLKIETTNQVDQQQICKSETSKDEELSNAGDEALKCIESINEDKEETILDEEGSANKSETSLKENDAAEKDAVEHEAGTQNQEVDINKTKKYGISAEENLKSTESSMKLDHTSEIVPSDQSNETIPETSSNKLEENGISESVEQRSQQSSEAQQETEEKIEPNMEVKDQIKETRSAEDIKAAILTEEVHEEVEKAEGDETIEHINKDKNDIKELHSISIEDERVDEMKEGSPATTEYLKLSEQTETRSLEVQEAQNIEKETTVLKEKEETKEADEGCEKAVGLLTTTTEETYEVITEQIIDDTNSSCNKIKATTIVEVTTEPSLEKVQTDEKPLQVSNIPLDAGSLHTAEADASQQESIKLEENSSNLSSQLPTGEQEKLTSENVVLENMALVDNEESRKSSDVIYETKNHDVEELRTGKVGEEIKEASETLCKSQDNGTVTEAEVAIDQTLLEEITKEHEAPALSATTENIDENMEKVVIEKDKSPKMSSELKTTENRNSQSENPRELEVSQLDLQVKKAMPGPTEEHEEKGGNLDDSNEESEETTETVSPSECYKPKAAIINEVADDQTFHRKKAEEQYQTEPCASLSNKLELGSSTEIKKIEENIKGEKLLGDEMKTGQEACLQKEGSREIQVSELDLELNEDNEGPNEAREEAREEASGTSVEIEEKKEASKSISESNLEGNRAAKEEDINLLQTNPMEKSKEQNQMPFYGLVSKEQEGETSTIIGSIDEQTKKAGVLKMESKAIEEAYLQKEEPRELEVSSFEFQLDKDSQESLKEIHQIEDGPTDGAREEIKEVSELVLKSSSEDNSKVADDEINCNQPPSTEKSKVQNQISSGLLFEEQGQGISTTAQSIEEKKTRAEMPENAPKTIEEVPLENKEPRELKSSQLKLQPDDDKQKECRKEVHEAKDGTAKEPLKLQPQHEIEKGDAAKIDLMATENQGEKPTDATEIMHNEVTNEQFMEEKNDAKNPYAITPGKEATKESYKEHQIIVEETLGTRVLEKKIQNVVLPEEIAKADVSETTEKQISKKGTVESLPQTFLKKETEKEHFKDETGEKINQEGRELNNENECDEAISGDGSMKSTYGNKKGLNDEASNESAAGLAEATEIVQDIHQQEKTSYGTLEGQISRQIEPKTTTSTSKKEAPEVLQEPNVETTRVTEVRDLQPAYTTDSDSKAQRLEHGVKHEVDNKNGKAIEETASKDSAKMPLFDMMQRSTRERQAAKELNEEREPTGSKEDIKTEKQTEEGEKMKSDEEVEEEEEEEEGEEEEVEEHKKNDSGSDAPVMVKASRDIEIKIVHKKSHNILSGVRSKVKHSIIKVKKAITGKSSHPKQQSPK